MEPLELPTVTVRGAPRQLGRGQGEAFRDEIRAFAEQRQRAFAVYARERGGEDRARARELFLSTAARCLDLLAEWDPLGYEEHCGVAEGAGVDAVDLYAIANMTDVRDVVLYHFGVGAPHRADEGCSAIMLPGGATASGRPLIGQTWDLNPGDLDYVVGVRRIPEGGPETWSVTCVGCATLIGINAEGVAVGTTNIKTRDARTGIGYLSVLHRALRCRDRHEAAAWIAGAPRAGAHNYWAADAGGGAMFECSATVSVRHDLAHDGAICRTNHCLAEALRAVEAEVPTASSRRRLERLEAAAAEGSADPETLRALFADRGDGNDSINRYPEDGQGTATNGCFVADPGEVRAWACRGPADRGRWIELSF